MTAEFPKKTASQSGKELGYSVEARTSAGAMPIVVGDTTYTDKWQRIVFDQGPIGIPNGPYFEGVKNHFNLYGYAAAQALRWWFHAQAEAMPGVFAMSLDTRIVKHEIVYSMEATAVSDHEWINGDDRSNIMPDWGKTAVPDLPRSRPNPDPDMTAQAEGTVDTPSASDTVKEKPSIATP